MDGRLFEIERTKVTDYNKPVKTNQPSKLKIKQRVGSKKNSAESALKSLTTYT